MAPKYILADDNLFMVDDDGRRIVDDGIVTVAAAVYAHPLRESTKEIERHHRSVGDTLFPVRMQLLRKTGPATWRPFDLAGYNVKVEILDDSGDVLIAETAAGVTIADPAAALVDFRFDAADVATPGVFWLWALVDDGSQRVATFPTKRGIRDCNRGFQVNLIDRC